MNSPYTVSQGQRIDALAEQIDAKLKHMEVRLWMGGEPTFVSAEDWESAQWQTEALGEEKRRIAGQLLQRLEQRLGIRGGLRHYGIGKCYPGERFPRWSLGCYWRTDGKPIWQDSDLLVREDRDYDYSLEDADRLLRHLVTILAVNPQHILPAYEFETNQLAGYVLPLLCREQEGSGVWSSCEWMFPDGRLHLLFGDSAIGLRLPLHSITWAEPLVDEALRAPDRSQPATPGPAIPIDSPPNSICVALTVEIQDGSTSIFLPPIAAAACCLDLVDRIETTARDLQMPVRLGGYPPPGNSGILGFQITPDPGVLEINIHPAQTWSEVVQINTILYEEAATCGLTSQKYAIDGRVISTGGGAHITIGGQTTADSPILRRPDLLRSLITYWQHHPSLSYLFADLFVGPTSQAPRVDEARHETLYELEIAFQALQPQHPLSPDLVDRLLRNLLVDVSGNTHRTEICVDKLFPTENPRGQLGIVEFRGFAMPPSAPMRLVQLLLVRSLVAWFWEAPYIRPLVRWGTALHDRFLLPDVLRADLQTVVEQMNRASYPFELDWLDPFLQFRFPTLGSLVIDPPDGSRLTLELRQAIEPWHVLGEEVPGSTSRPVDASMERLQVTVQGNAWDQERYAVTCNGYPLPLQSLDSSERAIAGVRFRARPAAALHPTLQPHSPLVFELIDRVQGHALAGCTYHVTCPQGQGYPKLPQTSQEARDRRQERFIQHSSTPSPAKWHWVEPSLEYPLTLDLRRVGL
jgi:uncharacterized protein (DUF2126 family)